MDPVLENVLVELLEGPAGRRRHPGRRQRTGTDLALVAPASVGPLGTAGLGSAVRERRGDEPAPAPELETPCRRRRHRHLPGRCRPSGCLARRRRDDRLVLDLAECPGERGNAYRYERGARRNGEPVRTRAQQRAVAGRTVREHLRRAHRVPAAPARRRAMAGLGTARRPAAGRRRRQRKSVAWTRSRPQRAEEVDRTSLEEGLRNATFPSAGWSRPSVVRGTTFGDDRGWVTNGDRQDHRVVLLGQQAQLLDVLLGDAQLRGLIAARRLDPLGRLANALGRGALDDHDGGGRPHRRPHSPPLSYRCLVPLPGRRTVRSGPRWFRRIRTRIAHGIVTAKRGFIESPGNRAVIRNQWLSHRTPRIGLPAPCRADGTYRRPAHPADVQAYPGRRSHTAIAGVATWASAIGASPRRWVPEARGAGA